MIGQDGQTTGVGVIGKLMAMLGGLAGSALPLLAYAQPQAAPSPEALALAAKFGAREAVEAASLSPDGDHLALISPEGDGQKLLVADFVAGGEPRVIMRNGHLLDRLAGCEWPTSTRLFCRLMIHSSEDGTLVSFGRMIALDADGKNLAVVTPRASFNSVAFAWNGGGVIDWNGSKPGQVLMTRQFLPEVQGRSHLGESRDGLGVELVDVTTLDRTVVEQPRSAADDYITDGLGNVRIMSLARQSHDVYLSGVSSYYYRKQGDRAWLPLSIVDAGGSGLAKGFEPVAVDPTLNVAFGFDNGTAGRRALYSVRLDGSGTRTLVLGRDDVDIDMLIAIGRQHRVIGAAYATERRQVEYFDPALGKLASALSKALPDAPLVDVLDASADENRLLLVASSDTDPGTLYRLDRTAHKLERIMALRPELDGVTLAPVTPISFAAHDGTKIPGYLTLPPSGPRTGLPAIVMPHGGPAARDEWGFDWLAQFFAARGFAVLQPNFRGSSGYGSTWFQHNGFQSWAVAIGDIDDAGRWLVAQKIADPAHLAIVGWSYGGYAALQSGVTEPGLFKAIVAVAPVTDLARFRKDKLKYTTGDLVDREIGHGDYVAAGSPALNAGHIAVPVLLFHGDQDINVDVTQSHEMADRLRQAGKQVDFVEFKGLDHQLDSVTARTTLLSRSDAFLRAALGM